MNGVFLFKKIIKIRLHAAELKDLIKKNKEIAEIFTLFPFIVKLIKNRTQKL
jgi:hypothetical protein